ncbi:MAG: aminotransferase class III-fold pyridoxal phosphate-dependent enzyme [Actinomycetota bacterium]|nr:aminotransferase class III-fold pyridoxal phosphate-dependent enzyme [Actinomycetota bacterium]MEC9270538.1 aminotransferase class III-fold pyridoxal phosphate-dependent enzyme [Actinomycetota bacterium]MEE2807404.1 aminotransferase class III-fold pyridoxal phosphate-dependent enzyme [Actinomycetota bacterium]
MHGPEVIDLCRTYSLFEWGTQEVNPLAIDRGEGCYLYTMDGRQILDFNSIAMNVNIGHGDQRVTEAVARQMRKVSFVSPFMVTEVRAEVARKLAEITPPGLTKSFFTLAGSDANEAAIRTARLVTGRKKILSRYRSYHGATHQVLALSGDPRREPVEGGMGDIVRIPDPYHYRCPWISDEKEFCEFNLDQIEQIIQLEGAHTVAAVIVEPITGSNGLIVPPDGWLSGLRTLCDRYDVLLICDEVMTGFGRTGEWFAVNHDGVTPDIMTIAKGITSGYIPLGACIVSDKIAEAVHDRPLGSGLTYQSHPVGLAAANATIPIYESDGLIGRSKEMGAYLLEGLRDLASRHVSVGDVRGRGLFTAMELVYDQESRLELFPLTGPAGKADQDMRQLFNKEGLSCALRGAYLFANPPLIVERSQIDWALSIFDRALEIADSATASAGAPAPSHFK